MSHGGHGEKEGGELGRKEERERRGGGIMDKKVVEKKEC